MREDLNASYEVCLGYMNLIEKEVEPLTETALNDLNKYSRYRKYEGIMITTVFLDTVSKVFQAVLKVNGGKMPSTIDHIGKIRGLKVWQQNFICNFWLKESSRIVFDDHVVKLAQNMNWIVSDDKEKQFVELVKWVPKYLIPEFNNICIPFSMLYCERNDCSHCPLGMHKMCYAYCKENDVDRIEYIYRRDQSIVIDTDEKEETEKNVNESNKLPKPLN